MKKVMIMLFIFISFIFVGCGNDDNKNTNNEKIFEEWKGKHKSVNASLNDPKLDEVYADIYVSNPNYTKEGAKAGVLYMLGTSNISGVSFEGNKATFEYTGSDGTKKTSTNAYKKIDVDKDANFLKFEAIEKPSDFSSVQYLYITKPHADEGDDMVHFHLKYGNHGFEHLEKSKSYPTFVKEDTSLQTQINHYIKEKEEIKNFLPAKPLNDWEGEWISFEKLLNEEKPEYDTAYNKLIKKFKKADNNSSYTKEEIKDILIKNIKSKIISLKIKKDSRIISIKDADEKVEEIEYKLTFKQGWTGFEAINPNNKSFKNLLLTIVHNDGEGTPNHFHFRNSETESFDSLIKAKNVPTMFDSKTTTEQIIEVIEEFGAYFLSKK